MTVKMTAQALVSVLLVACGASTPEPSTSAATPPAVTPASAPTASGVKSSPAPGSCEAVGGMCTSPLATVACKSQPSGTCPANEFCCVR
jgi:hypothetical protein